MSKIPYIDYKELREFYSISELCNLFNMPKAELKAKCEQYNIQPRRNEIGEFGLVRFDVRKLHNAIYHENNNEYDLRDDPWV